MRLPTNHRALDIDAARAALEDARTAVTTAEAAYLAAIRAGRPGGYEAGKQQTANINAARAALTLEILSGEHHRTVRFLIVDSSSDDGDSWQVMGWPANTALPGETATTQALRYAVEHHLTGSMMNPKPWRVRVWSDPAAADPDGEWTNLTEACPAGEHDPGNHPVAGGLARADGSTVRSARCARCFHRLWGVSLYRTSDPLAWVLEGEPLPDPEPGVICRPIECVKTKHYGMEINDGLGTWHTLIAVGPVDRETGKVEVTIAGRTAQLYATTMVQLRPAPVEHDGLAVNEHGVSLYALTGSLHYDASANEHGDGTPVGAWHLAGVDDNFEVHCADVAGAQVWAAAALADAEHGTVVGWQRHRDRYGELWTPTFAGDSPGPGSPGPGSPGPDATRTPTRTRTPVVPAVDATPAPSPDLSPDPSPVSFGFRVQTRTDGTWRTVRTGHTPPLWRPDRTALAVVADTVLGNAGPILGLGPRDALPPVRVRTWHRQTGLTGSATRNA